MCPVASPLSPEGHEQSSCWLTDAYRAVQLLGVKRASMVCGTYLGVSWSRKHKAGE